MEALWQDLRHGVRRLSRSPGFTLVAVLTLALGIGANTAIFHLLNAVLLRSLPVRDPEQLAEIRIANMEGARGSFTTWHAGATNAIWEKIRDRQEAFSGVFAWSPGGVRLSTVGEPRFASAILVSGSFFDALGVRPALGRVLNAADDRKGCATPGAVLSHAFWRRGFGGDTSVVGRRITLGLNPYEIVGVTPESFTGLEVGRSFDVALPLCAEALPPGTPSRLDSGTEWWLIVMGRLKPDQTLETASAHLAALSPGIFEASLPPDYPAVSVGKYLGFKLQARRAAVGISALREQYSASLWFLQSTAGLVLLIGCANLASLMLARAAGRERELSARVALGAGRGRLIRLLLAESLVLSVVAAVAGVWLADGLSRFLASSIDSRPGSLSLDLSLDWRVLGFASLAAILTGVLFGLAPALRAARVSPDAVLRAGGRGMTEGRTRLGLRRLLVVSQVCLSLVLVAGALLSARSLTNLTTQDTGMQAKHILISYLDMSPLNLPVERRLAFRQELVRRLGAVPGVVTVAETNVVPLSGAAWDNDVWMDGQDSTRRTDSYFMRTSAGYFKTMGIPLLAGRSLDDGDKPQSPPVAVVNETFTRKLVGGENPVGRRFWREATPSAPEEVFEIVGLVKDAKYQSLRQEMLPIAYLATPQDPRPDTFAQLLIQSAGPVEGISTAVKKAIASASPQIVATFQDYEGMVNASLVRDQLVAMLAGFFGVFAVLLATLGLYGVIAFAVARRTNEIGIRMALGADRAAILKMILGEALALVALGVVAGGALALALAQTVRTLVYGLEPNDPVTLVLASVLLLTVGLGASLVPARRAARLDPMVALRYQ